MKSRLGFGNFFFCLLVGPRDSGGLPPHDLPLTVAFQESASVEKGCDFSLSGPLSRADQSESHDRGVAVLLYAYIFGSVSGRRIPGLTGGCRTGVAHDVGLADSPPGRAGVDEVFSPEAVVRRCVASR